MASCSAGHRLSSITHSTLTMGDPVGGNVREEVTFVKNKPATRVTGCKAVDDYDVKANARFQTMITPGAKDTRATLTYTIKKWDGTTGTIAIANMKQGACGYDMNSAPMVQDCDFEYDPGDTESIAPITVSM